MDRLLLILTAQLLAMAWLPQQDLALFVLTSGLLSAVWLNGSIWPTAAGLVLGSAWLLWQAQPTTALAFAATWAVLAMPVAKRPLSGRSRLLLSAACPLLLAGAIAVRLWLPETVLLLPLLLLLLEYAFVRLDERLLYRLGLTLHWASRRPPPPL